METSNKNKVLAALEAGKGAFVSGGKLAAELGISRNSVWKAVRSLADEGYEIESVTGKGYRLSAAQSVLSAASIQHYLTDPRVHLEFHESIDSTNNRAKELAEAGAPEGTLVVADAQTAGRGRQGRPFYSPAGTGVYFSLVLRPTFPIGDIALITSYAAVAVARAVDEVFGVRTQIKWVNDLFLNGHKICGILSEASIDAETGSVAYVVVGIGINVMPPEGGFPEGVETIADAITNMPADANDSRARLVAAAADDFMAGYERIPERHHLAEYRERSLLDGREVEVYERMSATPSFRARVMGVNDDFTLRVQLEDGTTRDLVYGEVHIPSTQLGR